MKRNNVLAAGLALAAGTIWTLPSMLAAPNTSKANELSQEAHKSDSLDESGRRSAVRAEVGSAIRSAVDSSVQGAVDMAVRSAVDSAMLGVNAAIAGTQEGLRELPQIEVLRAFDDSSSWLGVETSDVTAEKAKELKLSAERGVVLTEVLSDSPAAKAGLKKGDVITEFNGQRVEGATQFRRFVHETPAGRAVQLTIWRDGNSQTISATLGKSEQRHQIWAGGMAPGDTISHSPRMPRMEMPRFEFDGLDGDRFLFRRPVLGISADNLSGQLGSYFGAPDGEAVLVREVSAGSAAEKAGIKAGDVITKLNGDRVRNVGDLRAKLVEKLGDKTEKKTVSINLLRERKERTLNVEVERPQAPKAQALGMRHRTI